MRTKHKRLIGLLALISMLVFLSPHAARIMFADFPVVHAALFYSPTCGHCHYVITETLPPLFEQYGDQFQLVGVDVTTPGGQTLYQAAIERFDIPAERRGVPTLILDETVLVGSVEIPEQLPGLIERYLAAGGVDYPDIPGLAVALQASESAADSTPQSTPDRATATAPVTAPNSPSRPTIDAIAPFPANESASDDLISRLRRDPPGNALAILVLVGMVVVIGCAFRRIRRVRIARLNALIGELGGWRSWTVAALCIIGLGVSFYLAYVETTHTTAVCGPIGDCNTVQQSPYALLFGLIPIGVVGILGYTAMLTAWAGTQLGWGQFRSLSESALFGMALFGTLFSIYLTFLEPFVIGATCAWCLTSAVSMTLILLVLTGSQSVFPQKARKKTRTETSY